MNGGIKPTLYAQRPKLSGSKGTLKKAVLWLPLAYIAMLLVGGASTVWWPKGAKVLLKVMELGLSLPVLAFVSLISIVVFFSVPLHAWIQSAVITTKDGTRIESNQVNREYQRVFDQLLADKDKWHFRFADGFLVLRTKKFLVEVNELGGRVLTEQIPAMLPDVPEQERLAVAKALIDCEFAFFENNDLSLTPTGREYAGYAKRLIALLSTPKQT